MFCRKNEDAGERKKEKVLANGDWNEKERRFGETLLMVKRDPSVGTDRVNTPSAAPMKVICAWNWRASC